MNDVDSDPRLERRIREALRAVAAATPIDEPAGARLVDLSVRRSPRPRRAVVAAVVILVAGLAAVALRPPADEATTSVGGTPASELPATFDAATASPVFAAPGEPREVATAYAADRFPDHPRPGVELGRVTVEGDRARVPWRTADDAGAIARGEILLRRTGEWWGVVAATTAGLSLGDIVHDGARVRGTVTSTDANSLFADVLDVAGEPVAGASRPQGYGEATYRFGTAGGPADHRLEIDVEHAEAPAVVRVHHVGGTILSIAEVRLEPPPLAAHNDYARCVETNGDERVADAVRRRCADALTGDVIASGVVEDRTWQLVASDEPSGHWVTLRARDQVGVFRIAPESPSFSEDVMFLQLGPCCVLGRTTVVAAALRPDVVAMRITVDGQAHEVATVADPGDGSVRYAVVAIRSTGRATAEVLRSGTWSVVAEDLGLGTPGG